jgi:hypothetical protein
MDLNEQTLLLLILLHFTQNFKLEYRIRNYVFTKKKTNAIERGREEVTYPTLAKWVQGVVQEVQCQGQVVEDLDVLGLCCPLAMTTLRYQQLKAYGNHYQVNSCSTVGMVSYDCGVAFIFNQQQMQVHDEDVAIQYVGVLKDIYL